MAQHEILRNTLKNLLTLGKSDKSNGVANPDVSVCECQQCKHKAYKHMAIQALSSLLEMTKGEKPRCGIPVLCQLKSTVF